MHYLVISLNIGGVVGDRIGNTKVDEFELALDEDKIGGLEIRVDNLLVMYDLNGLQHLHQSQSIAMLS